MKNIIYTPFIKSNKNDFPEITPRGYKRHYTSYEDVDDTEDVTIVTETAPDTETPETEIPEIDFSVPDINLKFTDKESFKTRMLFEYRSALEARGINPEFAKYLVAQDALETGWGSKPVGLYNYGNIKGRSGKTLEVSEFIDGKWENKKQTFKNYNNVQEYVNDKINLLSKKRYDIFTHPVTDFVSRIVSGGYATAPNYAEALNSVIASMRKGGILKFEKGGKDYLDNNRKHYNYQVGLNSFLPVGNIPYNLIRKELDNVNIVNYPPRQMEGTWDEYNGAINRITQRVHINKNSDNKGLTLNHEVGHLIVEPLIRNIEKLIKKWDGKIFVDDSIKSDSYLDSAKEIGARMYSYLQDSGYRGNVSSADTLSFVNSERDRFTSKYLADIINKDGRTRSKHDSSGNITFIVNSNSKPGLESRVIREYNDPYNIFSRYNNEFIYDLIKLFYATNDPVQKGQFGMKFLENGNKNSGWQISEDWHAPLLPIYINSKPDAPESVDGFKNAKEVYEYILSLPGSNPAIAAGWTGVFMKESGLNHNAINKSSGASGIAQLLGSRRNEYNRWLNGKSDTWQNQISWVWEKINNGTDDWQTYYDALKKKIDNGESLSTDEQSHWNSMSKSKYINYSFKNYRDKINHMYDPGDIAELMTWTFERPGDKEAHIDQRKDYANSVYNQFNY